MKIIEKRNYIILFIIIVLIIFLLIQNLTKKEEFSKTYNYFDHTIVVKIYENKDVFSDIDKIYKKYDKLDDELLDKIIKYGQEIYKKTDGYVDISKGNFNEGKFKTKIDVLDSSMKDDIDIASIIGGYATSEVVNYLEEKNIDKYLISDNGDITVGKHYDHKKYKVSINDPQTNEILEIVSLRNQSMVTRNDSLKSVTINPIEGKITKKYETVVVIADDINEATMLANAIYLMDVEDGKKIIKEYNASAFWYKNGEKIKVNFDRYIGD